MSIPCPDKLLVISGLVLVYLLSKFLFFGGKFLVILCAFEVGFRLSLFSFGKLLVNFIFYGQYFFQFNAIFDRSLKQVVCLLQHIWPLFILTSSNISSLLSLTLQVSSVSGAKHSPAFLD